MEESSFVAVVLTYVVAACVVAFLVVRTIKKPPRRPALYALAIAGPFFLACFVSGIILSFLKQLNALILIAIFFGSSVIAGLVFVRFLITFKAWDWATRKLRELQDLQQRRSSDENSADSSGEH